MLARRTRSWVKRSAAGDEVESRKKKKEDTRTTESVDNVATVPRQRRQKGCWYFATSRIKSAKCTDTAVAFTQEYSRVSYPLGNVSTLSTGLGSSKDTHAGVEKTEERTFYI